MGPSTQWAPQGRVYPVLSPMINAWSIRGSIGIPWVFPCVFPRDAALGFFVLQRSLVCLQAMLHQAAVPWSVPR